MNQRDLFERLLPSLHDAALDDTLWPATSRLVDEACGTTGSSIVVAERIGGDVKVASAAFYRRGERRLDLERDYYENYFRQDERVARLAQLRYDKLVRVADLFDTRELKTSATWNEALPRAGAQDGLNVRLRGLQGLGIVWAIADPVAGGWETGRIRMIRRLLPHMRSFIHVRHALAEVKAPGSSLFHLLDNARLAVIHLGRRGRIVEANDRARELLMEDNGLRQQDGFLRASRPEEDTRLKRLVAAALPTLDAQRASGSMLVSRPFVAPVLKLHIHPMTARHLDFGAPDIGAMVLITGLDTPAHLDAGLVGSVLGLTSAESRVALWLAEGKTVPDVAVLSGRTGSLIRTYLRRIHRKLGVSRRADLVRRLLSVAGRMGFRRLR